MEEEEGSLKRILKASFPFLFPAPVFFSSPAAQYIRGLSRRGGSLEQRDSLVPGESSRIQEEGWNEDGFLPRQEHGEASLAGLIPMMYIDARFISKANDKYSEIAIVKKFLIFYFIF